jgi:tight adherence protein B
MYGTPGSRIARAIAFSLVAVFLVLSPVTSAFGADIVLQDIDTGEYPSVSIGIALTADLVPTAGEPGFTLLENGIEVQDVRAQVATRDRAPIDVVLLVDVSGSMKGAPLDAAKAAAKSFTSSMRPTDRIALVAFSSEPRTVLGFGSDVAALGRAVDSLEASGETALHDGLIQAAKTFVDGERDRAIVVLSDGGDTTSINTLDVAADAVATADAPVYAVALESPEYDPAALDQLASRSGGRFVAVQDAAGLVGIFEDIAQELRNLYTLTYTSARPSTKDLEIEVRATNGDVTGVVAAVVDNPLYSEVSAPISEPDPVTVDATDTLGLAVVSLLVFAAVVLAVFGLGILFAPKPDSLQQLRHYEQYRVDPGDDAAHESTLQGSRAKVMAAVASIVEARGFTGMVHTSLERAGLPLRPNEYIFFHVLAATVVGIAAQFLGRNLLLTSVVVIAMVFAPMYIIGLRIDGRRKRFEEQLPDVLSLIAGSLRAGWGIQQALELVVDEIAEPAASEFRRVQSETRFGLPLEQALSRMAERLDSEDFRWTVTAIAIQREVGGNLAEVLDIVATTIRTRGELRRHVKALTAESRFSAIVMAILPFFIMGALSVVNPAYLAVLLQTTLGLMALAFGMVLLLVGIFWILRLSKVEV